MVTASRREAFSMAAPVMAQQEELGDLKLYRIPVPVTVAANSQKQVAMLVRPAVRVSQVYRTAIDGYDEAPQTLRFLKTRNRTTEGLGAPLPAGGVVLFAGGAERPILIGEGSIDDKAVGEDVEISFGAAAGVVARVTDEEGREGEFTLVVTNDRAVPIAYEALFADAVARSSKRLARRDGRPLWRTTVPANGRAELRYVWAED